MKKTSWLLLFMILIAVNTTYANQPRTISENFKFTSSKMDVGTMYHYIVSDIQGATPISIYIYVKSKDTVIIYRDYTPYVNNIVLLQTVKFNWNYMMAQEINGVNPLDSSKIHFHNFGSTVNFSKKAIIFRQTAQNEYVALAHYRSEPCYSYLNYHIDLQFALRFLKKPENGATITDYFVDQAREAQIHYLNDETIKGINCRKYELKRLGILATLFSPKAYFWLAKNDARHYTVKYVNYIPLEGWKNLKLELINQQRMSVVEWENYIQSLIATANSHL